MQSEKDKIMELLTITEVKEGGEVIFTDRSIEILALRRKALKTC